MNLNSIYIIFFSLIFCDECLYNWYDSNINHLDSTKVINLKSDFYSKIEQDTNSINLYIDNYNYIVSIELQDKLFIFDYNKSMKIYKSTNQIYIDYPDSILINNIKLLFNTDQKYFINSLTKLNKYDYKFIFDQDIKIKFKDNCKNIDSIVLNHNELEFKLFNIVT